ncbi:MAG: E3 ubiquitin-protein ligase hrd1 [Geoglossum umbratile]|nr:MAG: E3 ubiquitin-protein ligase hrd1 [Geoglossum umbratile]
MQNDTSTQGSTAAPVADLPDPDLPDPDSVDEIDIDVPGWDEKGQWVFYLDLVTDLIKLIIYMSFFAILLIFYGHPIHIMRDVFLTLRSFIKRIRDFLRYRRATRDMNDRYPDATVEEMGRGEVCIICREEMRPWQMTNEGGDGAGAVIRKFQMPLEMGSAVDCRSNINIKISRPRAMLNTQIQLQAETNRRCEDLAQELQNGQPIPAADPQAHNNGRVVTFGFGLGRAQHPICQQPVAAQSGQESQNNWQHQLQQVEQGMTAELASLRLNAEQLRVILTPKGDNLELMGLDREAGHEGARGYEEGAVGVATERAAAERGICPSALAGPRTKSKAGKSDPDQADEELGATIKDEKIKFEKDLSEDEKPTVPDIEDLLRPAKMVRRRGMHTHRSEPSQRCITSGFLTIALVVGAGGGVGVTISGGG